MVLTLWRGLLLLHLLKGFLRAPILRRGIAVPRFSTFNASMVTGMRPLKIMKSIIITLLVAAVTLCANAQKDVTKFLGIPVDGSKTEMIRKLKAKGFRTTSYDRNILEGEFNGMKANVLVVTNGNKVWRILVYDPTPVDARSIQIRFNQLLSQFENNPKYISLGNQLIPNDEDISYNILVNKKRYEAVLYQKALQKSNSTEVNMEVSSKKQVWFMITELLGQFGIIMFYDNVYNQANGEDL